MKIPPFFYILITLFIIGCAQGPDLKKENRDFYQLANRAKDSMSRPEYKRWLETQRRRIQDQLSIMKGQQEREGRILDHREVMTEGAASVGGPQDVHGFKADRSRQNLKRMEDRKKLLERHLFYINSQLSQLDTPLKF